MSEQMKADVAISKFKSAIKDAHEKAPKMKGRLLMNNKTGACFTWTPAASIENYMTLVSEEEQAKMVKAATAKPIEKAAAK